MNQERGYSLVCGSRQQYSALARTIEGKDPAPKGSRGGRRTPHISSLIRGPVVRQRFVAKQREFLVQRLPETFPKRQTFARLFNLHSAAAIFGPVWLLAALSFVDVGSAQRSRGSDRLEPWRTSAELARHLEEPVTWSWSGQTLAKALAGLAETDRLPSLVDRRVDPGKKLEVAVVDLPLRSALDLVAEKTGQGVTVLGPAVYWGPKESAEKLRTLAELRRQEADELRPQLRLALAAQRPLEWPRLSTPRTVVAQLAAEVGLRWPTKRRCRTIFGQRSNCRHSLGPTVSRSCWLAST